MKELKMESCVVSYDSWQMQCCGNPFSVGDKIEWTCEIPKKDVNRHGVKIDFLEEHHGDETHTITGTVTKIIAERSESPQGEKVVSYHEVDIICDELQHADGWESEYESDEVVDRTFWGYIVELKDVTLKKLLVRK